MIETRKDKQLFSDHKTERQVAVYDRKVKISPTLDLPVLGKSEHDDGELYTKEGANKSLI